MGSNILYVVEQHTCSHATKCLTTCACHDYDKFIVVTEQLLYFEAPNVVIMTSVSSADLWSVICDGEIFQRFDFVCDVYQDRYLVIVIGCHV